MSEYEQLEVYRYKDIGVRSEIVRDRIEPEIRMRVITIRSSCPSSRWAGRTSDYLLQTPEQWPSLSQDLETARRTAAETLAKQELGETSDKAIPVLGVQVCGAAEKKLNAAASIYLPSPHCLLGPTLIAALEMAATGEYYWTGQSAVSACPVFKGTVVFGKLAVETTFVGSNHNGPLLLGGNFIQSAVAGHEYVLQEVLYQEEHRVLEAIARTKKNTVLLIGAFGVDRERLERIRKAVATLGFQALIIDDFPAIEEQEFTEKMLTFASLARFVIADDFSPSGHIKELDICHYMKFITAVLRMKGRPATAMQDDLTRGVDYLKEFTYDSDEELEATATCAAQWADEAVRRRARDLNTRYDRGPFNVY